VGWSKKGERSGWRLNRNHFRVQRNMQSVSDPNQSQWRGVFLPSLRFTACKNKINKVAIHTHTNIVVTSFRKNWTQVPAP
jgi:hypothetical protein